MDRNEVALVKRKTVKVRCKIKIFRNDSTPSILKYLYMAIATQFYNVHAVCATMIYLDLGLSIGYTAMGVIALPKSFQPFFKYGHRRNISYFKWKSSQ